MSGEIKIFENEEFGKIRIVELDGEPMFCLSDVAKALCYSNPAKAVIDHCKGVTVLETPTNGGVQNIKYGKEGEVYRLIMKSKSALAEKFQDWVCNEVLPSIRKTGSYNLPKDYLSALKALVVAEEERLKLSIENQEMKPKADYFDALVERQLLTNFRDTAKELGIKQKDFISWLIENKYIYRDKRGDLKPYAKHTNVLFEIKDYTSDDKSHVGSQTLITPKGKIEFKMLLGNKRLSA